ncbi:HipA family kinase [Qipengyuania atrilutea]|uniref:HipA-like kinase domain-containing protein n=1 Tax=Qipengyuania atrilutea TaxID=2744473 RepID=A0A850H4T8_9SPHN|nr:HipA family kinase [Actirhodobacter atriluteus]NVD44908.1 hypothetical protein [Actirhodobacter atriluteus]
MSGPKLHGNELTERFTILNEQYPNSEGQLFPVRLRTREIPPAGAHIEFISRADDENLYYCKSDKGGLPCRMREAFYSQLATELALAPPDFRVVEDEDTDETFFGSRRMPSTATDVARIQFLRTERKDELGRRLSFPSRWFSQLYAFDLFIGNTDRSADNIIALNDTTPMRLRPIDFSAANLGSCGITEFPNGKTETVHVARKLRTVHSFFEDSALQMVDKIRAVPRSVIKSFFRAMPSEWVDVGERERIDEIWSGSLLLERVEALCAGLKNGHLL